ncbi:hypothetical protein DICPUDRAFT_80578 [Dictyostelium purpureum]|uniref:FNIP repeat-containing protein n=1 Tax=Dictyostelium purpureum TaxID=5786 RepID=F0ZQX0_DICPU|nr:uncharacterized protein DICPUDRAFT_80578 [Dictyostelium purpureum]EGC33653.1 hypothetical protein DICPUDRAFT_80578 [Dictyostelium purpureum]|eukprot:XP_003289823.1 hypothetical protein DICPUDRAFT_80578 [Dictyostelium purpureum]
MYALGQTNNEVDALRQTNNEVDNYEEINSFFQKNTLDSIINYILHHRLLETLIKNELEYLWLGINDALERIKAQNHEYHYNNSDGSNNNSFTLNNDGGNEINVLSNLNHKNDYKTIDDGALLNECINNKNKNNNIITNNKTNINNNNYKINNKKNNDFVNKETSIKSSATSKNKSDNNDNNNSNDKLFFKIWRNKVIRKKIKYHMYSNMVKRVKNNLEEIKKCPSELLCQSYDVYINQPLGKFIPKGTVTLNLTGSFNSPIKIGNIPKTVKVLKLGQNYTHEIELNSVIPSSVNELSLYHFIQTSPSKQEFPKFIKKLNIFRFNRDIISSTFFGSVVILSLHSFNLRIKPGDFPNTCEELILHSYNQQLDIGSLPPGLKKLTLGSFNQPIYHGSLSESITYLKMSSFNQDLGNSLISLTLLETLSMIEFKKTILENQLPKSIKILEVHKRKQVKNWSS